jgi:hypothetical protein
MQTIAKLADQPFLVVVLAALGIVCFLLTIVSGWREPFSVERTAVTLGGGNRIQLSKPMMFAIGTVACFALAALLMLYN